MQDIVPYPRYLYLYFVYMFAIMITCLDFLCHFISYLRYTEGVIKKSR